MIAYWFLILFLLTTLGTVFFIYLPERFVLASHRIVIFLIALASWVVSIDREAYGVYRYSWLKTLGSGLSIKMDGVSGLWVTILGAFILAHSFLINRWTSYTRVRLALIQFSFVTALLVLVAQDLLLWVFSWALFGALLVMLQTTQKGLVNSKTMIREAVGITLLLLAVFSVYFGIVPYVFQIEELAKFLRGNPAFSIAFGGIDLKVSRIFLVCGTIATLLRMPSSREYVVAPLEVFVFPAVSLLSFLRVLTELFPAAAIHAHFLGYVLAALVGYQILSKRFGSDQEGKQSSALVFAYFMMSLMTISYLSFEWLGWFTACYLFAALGLVALGFSDTLFKDKFSEVPFLGLILKGLPGTPGFVGFLGFYFVLCQSHPWVATLWVLIHVVLLTKASGQGCLEFYPRERIFAFENLPVLTYCLFFGLFFFAVFGVFGDSIQVALSGATL